MRGCVDESVEGKDNEGGVVRRVNPGMGAEAKSESRPKLVIRQQGMTASRTRIGMGLDEVWAGVKV